MLEGRTILITGSSRGIGRATAKLAKSYGANVIVHGRTDSEELQGIAKELNAEKVFFDVGNQKETLDSLQNLIDKGVKIDGLANVAGIVYRSKPLEVDDEGWLNVFRINVLGIMHTCQALIPRMQERKFGKIVNIASVRAYPQGTVAGSLAYSASKAAVVNITEALAKEFAGDEIYVNSVSPGGIDTDIAKGWDEEMMKRNTNVLLKRLGKPDEIGELICFLLSDKSNYITGQDHLVDGGYVLTKN